MAGEGGLLGQTAGRTGAAVVSWLDARGEAWKATVEVVAMDPHAGYRAAVAEALPSPGRRRPLPPGPVGEPRGHRRPPAGSPGAAGTARAAGDPAWAHRHLLLRAGDRLSPRARSRLLEVLDRDDPSNEIGAAWGVKELLRQLLAATDRHTIASRLHAFHEAVLAADMPETTRLALTVDGWWPEIAGFLQTRITNAGTEGTNRLIKDVARTAFGFRNLDNQRRRVRFHCTRRSRRISSAEAVLPPQLR